MWLFDEHEQHHIDDNGHINTIFKNYQKSGYGLNLHLLMVVFHNIGEVGLL